jgi:hypothetical protein
MLRDYTIPPPTPPEVAPPPAPEASGWTSPMTVNERRWSAALVVALLAVAIGLAFYDLHLFVVLFR